MGVSSTSSAGGMAQSTGLIVRVSTCVHVFICVCVCFACVDVGFRRRGLGEGTEGGQKSEQ